MSVCASCTCDGMSDPPPPGACCFLIAPDFDTYDCEDNVEHNDCMTRTGGKHYPNQTCVNIDCDADPPNGVRCNFETLDCGIDIPPPWEWVHDCQSCTTTSIS